MNIKATTVTKLTISEIDRLDPVSVILEDIEPRKGKITIECYGKAWSSYWGGMGDRNISEFFCSCDNGYLAGNLSPGLRSHVTDEDGLSDHAKTHIVQLRKERDINKEDARELYDEVDLWLNEISGHEDLLQRVYGDEWWYGLPEKINHEYEYLCRIIDAVRTALRIQLKKAA